MGVVQHNGSVTEHIHIRIGGHPGPFLDNNRISSSVLDILERLATMQYAICKASFTRYVATYYMTIYVTIHYMYIHVCTYVLMLQYAASIYTRCYILNDAHLYQILWKNF